MELTRWWSAICQRNFCQYFHRAYLYTSENSYLLRNKKKKKKSTEWN